MKITEVSVKNFRLLKNVRLTFDPKTTIIVGRNNSGKTSLTEILRRFLSDNKPVFNLEDFSLETVEQFNKVKQMVAEKKPTGEIREILPFIEMTLLFNYKENAEQFDQISNFIIDLDEESYDIIISIRYELDDGKIQSFFSDLTAEGSNEYFKDLGERIHQHYDSKVYIVDPTDDRNFSTTNFFKIEKATFIQCYTSPTRFRRYNNQRERFSRENRWRNFQQLISRKCS